MIDYTVTSRLADHVPAAVFGELSADGSRIVLIGAGPDYAISLFASWLEQLTPLVKPTDPAGGLTLPLSWPAVVQIGYILGQWWKPGPRLAEWINAELGRRTGDHGGLTPESQRLPEGLTPRQYQVEGALMIAALGRAVLFDDMGTGKTVTTILGLLERHHRHNDALPVVCVVPASTVDSWVAHWRDWAPDWQVTAWRGQNRAQYAGQADVYVASYDIARRDAIERGPLVKLGAKSVVVDECHRIKSSRARQSVATRRLARRAANFVALSGTPITHHPGDLWPTLEALGPLAWPAKERYETRYLLVSRGDYKDQVKGFYPPNEQEFRTSLLGQYRRVAKADVLDQLPPKVYSTRYVELPPQWRAVYDEFEADMLAELPEDLPEPYWQSDEKHPEGGYMVYPDRPVGAELTVMDTLVQFGILVRLACAPADVEQTTEIREDGTEKVHTHLTLKAPSWKADALLEVLDERPGQPVLAFAESRQLAELAGKAAKKTGRQVGYIVGGQTAKKRSETVEAFQKNKLDLLCATTAAGGVGLNLTAAGTVTFIQRPLSIVDAIQAEDRAHRIGSEIHDVIEIIDIIAANTIESRVRSLLRSKAAQLSDVVQDPRIVRELLGGSERSRKK